MHTRTNRDAYVKHNLRFGINPRSEQAYLSCARNNAASIRKCRHDKKSSQSSFSVIHHIIQQSDYSPTIGVVLHLSRRYKSVLMPYYVSTTSNEVHELTGRKAHNAIYLFVLGMKTWVCAINCNDVKDLRLEHRKYLHRVFIVIESL